MDEIAANYLNRLAAKVKEGIRAAGGTPLGSTPSRSAMASRWVQA
jgi:hypothetical protein